MIEPAKIQVRFADLDVLGHVNNSVYLSYFEMARVHYFGQLLGYEWDWKKDGIVLVKNEVEYLKPILLKHTPEIKISLDHLGTKSFTLSYEVFVGNEIHSMGKSTLVCFDSHQGKTIEVPGQMREALEKIKKEQKL